MELLLFFYFLSFGGVIHPTSHFRGSPSANEAGALGEDLNRSSPQANIATQRVVTQKKGIILDSVRVWL